MSISEAALSDAQKNKFSLTFCKIHRKTHIVDSLFNKVGGEVAQLIWQLLFMVYIALVLQQLHVQQTLLSQVFLQKPGISEHECYIQKWPCLNLWLQMLDMSIIDTLNQCKNKSIWSPNAIFNQNFNISIFFLV